MGLKSKTSAIPSPDEVVNEIMYALEEMRITGYVGTEITVDANLMTAAIQSGEIKAIVPVNIKEDVDFSTAITNAIKS